MGRRREEQSWSRLWGLLAERGPTAYGETEARLEGKHSCALTSESAFRGPKEKLPSSPKLGVEGFLS